jgi:hypothetical protein
MKIYILMTSLALMAGTAIGYLSGKDSAQSHFVSACTDTRMAVVYDFGSDEPRHFHCFELESLDKTDPPAVTEQRGKLVL